MSEEQDRAAFEKWKRSLDRWGFTPTKLSETGDCYAAPWLQAEFVIFRAGLRDARVQTAELAEAAAEAEKILIVDGHMGCRWEPTCAACQARKVLTDALANAGMLK